MIQSINHKGLRKFWESGVTSGINASHAAKLRLVLGRLDAATQVQEMNFHGSRLHRLKGDKKDLWSVTINGNWRMTFEFKDGDAYLVDYLDYH